jgi:hypothetical protein
LASILSSREEGGGDRIMAMWRDFSRLSWGKEGSMKRLVALSYMVGLPVVLGLAKVMPGIVLTLLFASAPTGLIATYFGVGTPVTMATFATVFGYFVSGFFPTGGGISNFIMGL